MTQELNRMSDIIKHVQDSVAQREVDVKEFKAQVDAYDAETKRIAAVQVGMTEEQIQDIAMGVVAAAMESQMAMVPMIRDESPEEQQMMPPEQQMGMPQ